MDILVDTATFLWWVEGSDRVPKPTVQLLRDPTNRVVLSAASAWEITVKHALGKLSLPRSPDQWVPEQRDAHDILPLPIGEADALHVGKLPPLHRDPFDRILVAQAIVHGLEIATRDPAIQRYPCRWVWRS